MHAETRVFLNLSLDLPPAIGRDVELDRPDDVLLHGGAAMDVDALDAMLPAL